MRLDRLAVIAAACLLAGAPSVILPDFAVAQASAPIARSYEGVRALGEWRGSTVQVVLVAGALGRVTGTMSDLATGAELGRFDLTTVPTGLQGQYRRAGLPASDMGQLVHLRVDDRGVLQSNVDLIGSRIGSRLRDEFEVAARSEVTVSGADQAAWLGDWRTSRGLMKLRVERGQFVGELTGAAGTATDRVAFVANGSLLSGAWTGYGGSGGDAVLQASADGSTFTGYFVAGADGTASRQSWTGSRVAGARPQGQGGASDSGRFQPEVRPGLRSPRPGYTACPVGCEVRLVSHELRTVTTSAGTEPRLFFRLAIHNISDEPIRLTQDPGVGRIRNVLRLTGAPSHGLPPSADEYRSHGPLPPVRDGDIRTAAGRVEPVDIPPGAEVIADFAVERLYPRSEVLILNQWDASAPKGSQSLDRHFLATACRYFALEKEIADSGRLPWEPSEAPAGCATAQAASAPGGQGAPNSEPPAPSPAPTAPQLPQTTPVPPAPAESSAFAALGAFDVRFDRLERTRGSAVVRAAVTVRNATETIQHLPSGTFRAILTDADGAGQERNQLWRGSGEPATLFNGTPALRPGGEITVRFAFNPDTPRLRDLTLMQGGDQLKFDLRGR